MNFVYALTEIIKMLTIDKFYNSGFKRFFIPGIKTFDVDFSSPLQIFLGSNGSGKSSLMERLIGDPGAKHSYDADGMEVIEYTKDGHKYRLSSEFKAGVFLFEKDDVNLNESRKVTEQRDLITRELGLSKDTINILTGKIKFTELAGPNLMKILMQYSNLDLEYALEKFEKAKSLLRDQSGILTHLHTKLTDTETRLYQYEDSIETDSAEIIKLQDLMVALIPYINNGPEKEVYEKKIVDLNSKINSLLDQSFRQIEKVGIESIADVVSIESHIETVLVNKIAYSQAMVDTAKGELAKLNEITGRVENLTEGAGGLEGIRNRVSLLEGELLKISKIEFEVMPVEGSTALVYNKLITFREVVINISSYNATVQYMSGMAIMNKQAELDEFFAHYNNLKSKVEDMRSVVQYFSNTSAANLSCGNCGTEVIGEGGCTHTELAKRKEKLVDLEVLYEEACTQKVSRDLELASLNEVINVSKYVNDSLKPYTDLIHNTWSFTLEDFYKENSRIQASVSAEIMRHEMYIASEATSDEFKRLTSILDHLDDDSYEGAVRKTEELSIKYLDESRKLNTYKAELVELETIVRSYYCLNENNTMITDLSKIKDTCTQQYFDAYLSDIAKREMSEVSANLSRLLDGKKRYDHLVSMKDSYKQDILKAEEDLHLCKLAAFALSPKTGIVGDQMKIFLDGFFGIINSVLERIYEYDIRVVFDDNKESLDYKFMLNIEGENKGSISEGSLGQREIINLAFTLAIMEIADLRGYPMFFDEFGTALDDAHRDNFIDFQRRLLESGQVSQIFMASHLLVMHSSLSNHQTLVLHADNLANLPETYNQHVVMEY